MSRNPNPAFPSGVIVIDKPADMTSHDVVAIARKKLRMRQIGHTGTLDPMATGVLPLCLGAATRYADYIMNAPKTYRCVMKFGLSTTTQDIWGEVVSEHDPSRVTSDQVRSYLTGLPGEILQIPPAFSAIRVDGARAFDLARKGEMPVIEARTRSVYSVDIKNICLPEVEFEIACSKGTYIRTICHDMGEAFGCGGVMTSLTRIASGGFRIEDSIPLEMLSPEVLNSGKSFFSLDEIVSRIDEMGVIRIDGLNAKSRKLLDDGVKFDLLSCRNARIERERDVFTVYMDGKVYGLARRKGERIEIAKRFV